MAIKLAFSTVACPEWTIEQVAAKAAEFGYQGVELRTLGPGGAQLASDPALTDPAKVADALKKHNITPVCLSTSEALHHADTTAGHGAVRRVREQIELASKIGCGYVRVFGYEVGPGENRKTVMKRIVLRAQALADRAGELGIRLLFENAGSFADAKDWWNIFNLLEHPAVRMCWNVANAAASGEGPAVSVPMLHRRIVLAKVKDLRVGEGSGYVPLGEGTVEIQHFIKRLMGIGYDGFVSVEWDRAWLPSLTPADEYLPDAHKRLTGWIDTLAAEFKDGQDKTAKAQAKAAPKPRARAAV